MEYINKYKSYIIGAIYGAVAIIVLGYLISIPAWLVGAIIGATTVPVAAFMDKYFDQAIEKGANAVKKKEANEASASDEEAK